MSRLGVARCLVDGQLIQGDIEVVDGCVAAVAIGDGGGGRGTASPGFVDAQVNGFAGVDFMVADADSYGAVAPALLASGVTAYQPTLITAEPHQVLNALQVIADLTMDPTGPQILGVHLEGPFISPRYPGAHPPEHLRDPDIELVDRYRRAGPVTMLTLAPELPGSLPLIDRLVAGGVTVCCGHTDADAVAANAAFDRGARAVTHLFNAMRPFSHRDPGVAGAALCRNDVVVPVIADKVHLSREALVIAARVARGRLMLVTDATAAAGMPDGRFHVGEIEIVKAGMEVRRSDGTLAGSALTMDAAIREAVDAGVDLAEALLAASAIPAGLLGRQDLGHLAPGSAADVVVLDDDLQVDRVLRDGRDVA